MLVVKDLVKSFGDKTVVNKLNINIYDGKVVGFVGHNGAGKTTTLKMIAGILPIDSGEVILNNKKIGDKDYQKQFTIVFDNPDNYLFLKGIEYLQFICDIYEVDKTDLDRKITDLATEFEMLDVLNDKISTYSHGMRQKIMVLGAVIVNPKIWILDEPLTGLDPVSSYKLKEIMKKHASNGNIVLFSTHVLETVEKLCDEVIIIKQGFNIYSGTLDNLRAKEEYKDKTLEEIFLMIMGVNYNG